MKVQFFAYHSATYFQDFDMPALGLHLQLKLNLSSTNYKCEEQQSETFVSFHRLFQI